MPQWDDFLDRGWLRFAHDPVVADWAGHALNAARTAVGDPVNARWWQCENTWFVGVDVLDNDPWGQVAGTAHLSGPAIRFITAHIGAFPLHRAQVSVIKPGYPRPRSAESAAAFGYRQRRDAAHVDGLLAIGPHRQRQLREPHAYILGLPLTKASPNAAPLVVWQGSHHIMREAFNTILANQAPATWPDIDITKAYKAARRRIFETCRRIEIPAQVGESTLIHRHTLHGVAPWADSAKSDPDGRMIAYFRPQFANISDWLSAP